jgi:hypothetical protein
MRGKIAPLTTRVNDFLSEGRAWYRLRGANGTA